MLRRVLLIVILVALCSFALQSCSSWYFSMQLAQVGGQPYLVLEHRVASPDAGEMAFSIYRAKGHNLEEWAPVVTSRLGRAYAVFAAPLRLPSSQGGVESVETGSERLAILHQNRATFYDVSAKTATPTFELLPFSWIAETVRALQGRLVGLRRGYAAVARRGAAKPAEGGAL